MSVSVDNVILKTEDLRKSFGGIQATKSLSLTLRKGVVTGLIGPNGAGKTTAFNLITGFIKPDHGRVLYNNQDITGWPSHKTASIGVVRTWQHLRLFMKMSVLDHILLARQEQPGESIFKALLNPGLVKRREAEDYEIANDILDFVGLKDKKYDFAQDLSYAEQKLLSLARVMAMDAEIILFDEPMSGLDGTTLEKAKELIRNLAVQENKAVCIIEHNVDFIADTCDQIVFLDQGQVIAEGTPDEVMSNAELTKLYFGG